MGESSCGPSVLTWTTVIEGEVHSRVELQLMAGDLNY